MYNDKKIHILIASAFSVFRIGLKSILKNESIISIADEATTVNEVFSKISIKEPDVLILNLELESESLNSLCQNIHEKHPGLPILLFLNETIEISIADLIINGVRGIIWKENTSVELKEAIQCLANGGSFFEDPDNCRFNCHLSHKIHEEKDIQHLNELLTNREKDVIKLIGLGMSYKEIANKFKISSRTVESHKNSLLSKLHLSNKYELIKFAIENFHK